MQVPLTLLNKYNQPVPRYTSYPTVPFWNEGINVVNWKNIFQQQFIQHNSIEGISIYLHLPFCESLCTYCGCNKKITQQHAVEDEYINIILKEWNLYLQLMEQKPILRELHIGGGTPTFFSPHNLQRLLSAILTTCIIHPKHEFSFEGHPNNTTYQHLMCLYQLGFTRVSFGVQDCDAEVQRLINRIQPFKNVQWVTEKAREIGYHSVNFDLIYGLPGQTLLTMEKTIEQSVTLMPDRVAFYSYAHVPWTSKAQRLFDDTDLPTATEKMKLYQLGKQCFANVGYNDVGMDHFALPHDSLFLAKQNNTLHRNFMGYTTQHTSILLGLGVSSISDAGVAYAQNYKTMHDYYASIQQGELAVTKGIFLTSEDMILKKYIIDVACKGNAVFLENHLPLLQDVVFPQLEDLVNDGLVQYNQYGLSVTSLGNHFIRNICKAFDARLQNSTKTTRQPQFSNAV